MTQGYSLRHLGRAVREALAHPAGDGAPPTGLDLSGLVMDPPRMGECAMFERTQLEAIPVVGAAVGFRAFLDGTQRSHVADYAGTIPIVAGLTAAVIRARVDRRMTTWANSHVSDARLYAPLRLLALPALEQLESAGLELQDTLAAHKDTSGHPIELLRFAVDAVKFDRERLEQGLAESWAESTADPLFVDGGLPTGRLASASLGCVGVIKSHHTIYAPGDALPTVLGLAEDERSSAFVIQRSWGPPVLSWYLRLREPPSHDPFMGLVRVEIARRPELTSTTVADRADEVSRWILSERAPLALPDARWDRMVYGIRDCEEYLRATTAG